MLKLVIAPLVCIVHKWHRVTFRHDGQHASLINELFSRVLHTNLFIIHSQVLMLDRLCDLLLFLFLLVTTILDSICLLIFPWLDDWVFMAFYFQNWQQSPACLLKNKLFIIINSLMVAGLKQWHSVVFTLAF